MIRASHATGPFQPQKLPRFSGTSQQKALPAIVINPELPIKLHRFQQELQDIIAWDQAQHATPVIKDIHPERITQQAKRFLVRQSQNGTRPTPYMIGLAGGTASGKTYTKHRLQQLIRYVARYQQGWKQKVNGPVVDGFDLDYYYKDTVKVRQKIGDQGFFQKANLDEPDALTMDLATRDAMRVKNGLSVRVPFNDFVSGVRTEGRNLRSPAPFFLVEGLFALVPPELRKLFDLKIFVDTDRETVTRRWWNRAASRNVKNDEAGRSLFNRGMEMHDVHVEPSKAHADIVLKGGIEGPDLQETLKRLVKLLVKTFYPPQPTGVYPMKEPARD